MERKPMTKIINEIVEKQQQLVEMNERLARYARNADNDGTRIRAEIISDMRKALDDIEKLNEEVINY